MRMINRFLASVALNAIFLGTFAAISVPASAAEPQIAGYCLYFHENSVYYRTPVFRAPKDKRDRWKTDWANHLYESGVKYYGGYGCRAWDGGADAAAAATEAAAKPPLYTQRTVEMDWIPEDTIRASGGGSAALQRPTRRDTVASQVPVAKSSLTQPAPPKYIEVAGPNGTQRLSPEVAARNKAAEEDYRRKMDEHARERAAHERKLALHQQSIAAAAAEKREYERQLAANAAQVAAHKAKMEVHNKNPTLAGGPERTFQATSPYRATKDEAMAWMRNQNLPPISDVQCKEVTFYEPARWTCWGTYQQAVSQSSTSKQ